MMRLQRAGPALAAGRRPAQGQASGRLAAIEPQGRLELGRGDRNQPQDAGIGRREPPLTDVLEDHNHRNRGESVAANSGQRV